VVVMDGKEEKERCVENLAFLYVFLLASDLLL
jgi:hypothetical protein